MKYRKEIDGLRAVAVIPVILFHAGVPLFSGGYIGVDIFFVISGYLITSIIIEEIDAGEFSFKSFYERRARRILPALSIVLIFSSLMAYVFMPAELLKSFSQSLTSITLFSSNIYFYLTNDYFSTASDEMPLLHTWSLSVEEQYYFFFPIMLIFLWKFGKKFSLFTIVVVAIASLLLAQNLSSQGVVNANFYLIFSRAWELLFGSSLAFLSLKKHYTSKVFQELLGLLGLVLIIFSIIVFDSQTPFPSLYTLIPVIGTCLIIIFSCSNSLVGALLSKRVFVFFGLISYSLYLWHQPLFAFLRMKTVGEPSGILFLFAIAVTLILSYLSFRYIEKPFRNKLRFNRRHVFLLSSCSIICFLALGLIGHFNKGFDGRFNAKSYSDSIVFSPKRKGCHTKGIDYLRPKDSCKYFGDDITWASIGDSHIVEPTYALANRLRQYDLGLVHLSFSGCPPSIFFESKQPGCTKWYRESLKYLENSSSIKNVLIGFRYSAFLYGDQLNSYPKLPNIDPRLNIVNAAEIDSVDEIRERYWRSFEESISRLINSGKKVFVMYPIPELPLNIRKAIIPYSVLSSKTVLDLKKSSPVDYYFNRNQYILNKLDSLKYSSSLVAIKPFDVFCEDGYCSAVINEKSMYFDDDHLSTFGAQLLIDKMVIDPS